MQRIHDPVMVREVISFFKLSSFAKCARPLFIDGCAGLGGHSKALLDAFPSSTLLCIDRDPIMKRELFTRLSDYRERVTIVTDTYANAAQYLKSSDCNGEPFERKASGILLDLGFNSVHVDEAERGFSFQRDGPLDMRYDPLEKVTAADLVNQLDSKSLAAIFVEYSGESYRTCKHIANVICQRREQRPFTRTLDLANCVNKALPKKNSGKTPCTGIFQALRIAVNDEYSHLNHFMESLPDLLDSGGVGVFLCFQSLEIRIIKKWIRQFFSTNTQPQFRVLTPQLLRPSAEEVSRNIRSRSTILYAVQRLLSVY